MLDPQMIKTLQQAQHSLVLCGLMLLLVVTIVIERWLTTRREVLLPQRLTDPLRRAEYGLKPPPEQLEPLVEEVGGTTPFAVVVRSVARVAGRQYAEVRQVADEACREACSVLRRPVRWLEAIYAVSTLAGLLASISSMVGAFASNSDA